MAMNEKLLILYLERLLDKLHLEINKADNMLGPDVHRLEVVEFIRPEVAFAPIFGKVQVGDMSRSLSGISESEAKPTTTTIGDVIALASQRLC